MSFNQALQTELTFTIVTICRNNIQGLIRTRQSVFSQTFKDFEWVVIDGASKDGTKEYLEGIAAENICWLSEPDNGLYDAMNKGIEKSSGQYLLFMNSGDEFADEDVLQDVVRLIRSANAPTFIYGDSLERGQSSALLYKSAHHHKYIWYGMFTHHQSMLYGRKALGEIRYRAHYPIAADYALTAEFLSKFPKIVRISRPICIFEGGGLTSLTMNQWRGIREQWHIGRGILGMYAITCVLITMLHIAKRTFIGAFPELHKRIRFGKR